jgi:DNA polymerase III subunit delta
VPQLTEDALTRLLQGEPRGGVFFLHGEEEYLRDAAVAAVVAAHLDPATRDFNLDQLRGGDVEPETLASVAQTPPLMATWRVVVVREAQALSGSPRLRAAVEAVLDRPVPGLVLVLSAHLPAGTKAAFWERLKREATAVEFAPLAEADVPAWLMARAEAEGFELERTAARALAAAVGGALGVLAGEIAKLKSWAGDRTRLGIEDVEAVVGPLPRQNRWEWIDMVGEARFQEARGALPVLLDAGENGVGLVLGLGTHFQRLALLASGGEAALEAVLTPPQRRWLPRRIAAQARHWSEPALDGALDDLLRADRLLKSSGLGDGAVVEELLLRLQQRAGR